MKKAIITITILMVLFIILSRKVYLFGERKSPVTKEETKLDKVNVRLKWLHQAQFAGFYTADKKEFYKKNGIEVVLNPGGVDFPAVQMVTGGDEQFGVAGADSILLAREEGIPVVALAVIYRKNPLVLFSLKNSGITQPKDLVGKKFGLIFGNNSELIYRAMMKNAGVDMSKITEIPTKYDLNPLFSGQIDARTGFITNEVIMAQEKGFEVNVIRPDDYGVKFYADTLFTTEKMIKDNPDLVKRFVKATLEGWNYAYDHPEEAVDYTLKYSDQLNKEHETKMMLASLELLKPEKQLIGYMDQKTWEDMQQLLLNGKFMTESLNIEEVYTNKFLE